MATTSVTQLIQQVRRYCRDWPDQDVTTASLSSSGTSVTVADTTRYAVQWPIQIESENMIVRALASATSLTVLRGAFGSTAATHVTASEVLVRPAFMDTQILDAINAAIQAAYPYVYQEVMDTSLSVLTNQYEYTIPNMPGTYGGDSIVIPRLRGIDIQDPQGSTTLPYVPLSGWNLRRDITAPKIKINYLENPGANLRVRGYGPFPDLVLGGSLHAAWPRNFTQALVEYAASCLMISGEAGRSRSDTGILDNREAAQKPGAALQVSSSAEARWARRLANAGMPPMQSFMVVTR